MPIAISVSKRGSLTLPKCVRERLGIPHGGEVVLEANEDGTVALRLRPDFPMKTYSAARFREFHTMNNTPPKRRRLRFRNAHS